MRVLVLFYLSCHVSKLVLFVSDMKTISCLPSAVCSVSLHFNGLKKYYQLSNLDFLTTKVLTTINLQMNALILVHVLTYFFAAFLPRTMKAVANPFLRVISWSGVELSHCFEQPFLWLGCYSTFS